MTDLPPSAPSSPGSSAPSSTWRADLPARSRTDRYFLGVCAGIAERVGLSPLVVRILFVVVATVNGVGILLYALGAVLMPSADNPATLSRWEAHVARGGESARRALSQRATRRGLGVGCLLLGGILFVANTGWHLDARLLWPLLQIGVGFAVAWSATGDEERGRLRWTTNSEQDGPGRPRLVSLSRMLGGGLLVVLGVGAFLASRPESVPWAPVLAAVAATIAGVLLIMGPWTLGLLREAAEERQERIRVDERGQLAVHLHDSVLQTLALVQRNPGTPREVVALVRRQERELRNWLYGTGSAGPGDAEAGAAGRSAEGALADRVRRMADEIEDTHGVAVDVVHVGDAPLDDRLDALVQAGREAVVNAAKHAGVRSVSVYLEVDPARVELYVRDRGCGFDPGSVDLDRHGLRESIRGRLRRLGGEATVFSVIGEGTEVILELPR